GGSLAFRPKPDQRVVPTVRATSSALRALKYFGGEPNDKNACAEYIKKAWDEKTGTFSDLGRGGPGEVAPTAVGLMAVVELKLALEPYAEPASKYLSEHAKTFEEIRIAVAGFEAINKKSSRNDEWLATVQKMKNPDGTYGKGDGQARDTGGAVVATLRMGAKLDDKEKAAVLKTLNEGQRDDGGFGKADTKTSDLETSYRVMRAYWMLKARPDAGKLTGFIAKCRNEDGGYGAAPGQSSTVSDTYFAGIILHWLAEK